jgi:hypothetical protein
MKEVFRRPVPADPGEVFYTITAADVGTSFIETEIGPIVVASCLGEILPSDVGRRLYRVAALPPFDWTWLAETVIEHARRAEQLNREAELWRLRALKSEETS